MIILLLFFSCQETNKIISENIFIKIYPYNKENKVLASALAELKETNEINKYKRRFDYILINTPKINQQKYYNIRNEIGLLYPDTNEIRIQYLKQYLKDINLKSNFITTYYAITNIHKQKKVNFTINEMMNVASRFFYCDKVNSDTSVEAHVCIGLNGIKDVKWKRDYTLLEAFCYEGIFNDFDKNTSEIWESFSKNKMKICAENKKNINSLNDFLLIVREQLIESMKEDKILKQELLNYYDLNKKNLSFNIISK